MTSPDNVTPSGAFNPNTVYQYQSQTKPGVAGPKNTWLQQVLEGVRGNLFNGLLSGFTNIGEGIGAAVEGIVLAIVGGGSGTLTELEQWGVDLQSLTQRLEGVIGYGSARMPNHFTPGNTYARCPFTTRVGPIVGVTHNASNGTFVLGSRGLWEFSAKVIFDFLLFGTGADNGVFMDLVVFTPGGTEFYRAKNLTTSGPEVTLNETGRFVVPEANYRVEIQAKATINYRGMLGNQGFNQLNLLKISSETS